MVVWRDSWCVALHESCFEVSSPWYCSRIVFGEQRGLTFACWTFSLPNNRACLFCYLDYSRFISLIMVFSAEFHCIWVFLREVKRSGGQLRKCCSDSFQFMEKKRDFWCEFVSSVAATHRCYWEKKGRKATPLMIAGHQHLVFRVRAPTGNQETTFSCWIYVLTTIIIQIGVKKFLTPRGSWFLRQKA